MLALRDQLNLADFFRRLQSAPNRALLLDYDGTLAPFRVQSETAIPYPGVCELLDAIMRNGHTRVVLVSGRGTKDLIPLLGLKRSPEIWGSHGWERLAPDGEYTVACIDEKALARLAEADTWTEKVEAQGGRCEKKPGGLAIHWRGLGEDRVAVIRNLVFQNWRIQQMYRELVWHDFDGGIELRAPGRDKGFVIDSVLSEMGQETAAAYLGDDLTDEDAFKAIHGKGVSVLVRPQFRPTVADFWITPPQELLAFLRQWRESTGATP
jgi:trehalose 6-phosphate phosphatase